MVKPPISPSKKALVISLVIAGIIFLVLAAVARENLAGMVQALSKANYGLIMLAFGAYLVSILLLATRWRISLSAVGCQARLHDLYLVIFGGIFINNITPFTYAGGDPVARTYLLNKIQRVPYSSGFATIIGEFMLDIPIFLSFLVLGLLTSFYTTSTSTILIIIGVWVVVVISMLLVFSRVLSTRAAAGKIGRFVTHVLKALRRRISKTRIVSGIENFYAGTHSIVGRVKVASLVASFSAIIWIFGMIRLFLIFQAFPYPPPPLPMLMLAVTLPAIVGLVPLLPGGLGTVDATIASVFIVFGVPADLAISVTLIERSITLVFGTAIGAGVLSYLGVKVWRK